MDKSIETKSKIRKNDDRTPTASLSVTPTNHISKYQRVGSISGESLEFGGSDLVTQEDLTATFHPLQELVIALQEKMDLCGKELQAALQRIAALEDELPLLYHLLKMKIILSEKKSNL